MTDSSAGAAYWAIAREGRPGLWRLPIGVLLLVAAYFGLTLLMLFAINSWFEQRYGFEGLWRFETWVRGPGVEVTLAVVSLALTPLLLALVLRVVHGRGLASLMGLERRLNWRAAALGAATAAGVGGIALAVAWGLGWLQLSPIARPDGWWVLILFLFLLIPFQAGVEELVFRGYMAQELGARWGSFLAWGLGPSILFALGHYVGPERGAGPLLFEVFLFGVFAAILVWRTGGLSAAIGFHTANNWIALLVFEPDIGIEGVGFLKISVADPHLWPMALLGAASFGLCYLILSRTVRPERAPPPPPPAARREPTLPPHPPEETPSGETPRDGDRAAP